LELEAKCYIKKTVKGKLHITFHNPNTRNDSERIAGEFISQAAAVTEQENKAETGKNLMILLQSITLSPP